MYCMHKVKINCRPIQRLAYIQTDMQTNYNITCSAQYKAAALFNILLDCAGRRLLLLQIQGATGPCQTPNHQRFFYKVCFLMSFQIFLDSIIDLSNETITFINWSCICRLAHLEFNYLLISNSASLIYKCKAVGSTFCRVYLLFMFYLLICFKVTAFMPWCHVYCVHSFAVWTLSNVHL